MVGQKSPSKKKRVLVVVRGIESTRKSKADIARRIEALCANFDVIMVTSSSKECKALFCSARVIGIPQLPLSRQGSSFILMCWLLLPFIKSEVVYLSEVYNAAAILTLFRRKIVCYGNTHPMQHVLAAKKRKGMASAVASTMYSVALKRGLRKCNLILSISPQLSLAFRMYGIREDRVQTLETGVPIEDFRSPASNHVDSPNPFVAMYHGTVSFERGLQVMIDGVKLLSRRRRDFRVRLVGCDKGRIEYLSRVLSELGISDLFELNPPVPNSEIPKILRSAHCGVSLLEPNVYFSASPPLKVLEYLAAGLPVIANDLPTHHLYLRNEVDSLLIEYAPASFADAMERMIVDSSLRMSLSRNAILTSVRHSDSGPIAHLVEYVSSL